jgi:hypothetical protein
VRFRDGAPCERHVLAEDAFAEIVIWRLPHPAKGSTHRFKYRLAMIVAGECVLRYDNEKGKGDHRHAGDVETVYTSRPAGNRLPSLRM